MAETQYWRTERKKNTSHGNEQRHIFQTFLPDDLHWGSFDRFLPHAEVHYVDKTISNRYDSKKIVSKEKR